VAVLAQPAPTLLVVRKNLFDKRPEPRGVVLFHDVKKLVDQNVIDHLDGRHHDPPGKTEAVPMRAGSPTTTGARDSKSRRPQGEPLAEEHHPFGKSILCLFLIPFDKNILRSGLILFSKDEAPKREFQRNPAVFVDDLEGIGFTQVKKRLTLSKGLLDPFPENLSFSELLLDPRPLFSEKLIDRLCWGVIGNSADHFAVLADLNGEGSLSSPASDHLAKRRSLF